MAEKKAFREFKTPLKIKDHAGLMGRLNLPVIPIMPFLIQKASIQKDASLDKGVNAISCGMVPNTAAWCDYFNTTAPVLISKPIDGRRLMSEDEPGQ